MFKLIKNNGVQILLNCKKEYSYPLNTLYVSLQNTYVRPKKYGPNISVQKVKKKVQSTSSKEIQYTCAMQKSIKKVSTNHPNDTTTKKQKC